MSAAFVLLFITLASTLHDVGAARNKLQLAMPDLEQAAESEPEMVAAVDHPKICAATVVKEVCLVLNKGGNTANLTTEEAAHEWEAHAKVWVPWSQIQSMVAADSVSIQSVYTALRAVSDMPEHWHPDVVMRCMDICHGVMKMLDVAGRLPPSSDVGCYGTGSARRCDLDLSLQSMKPLLDSGDLPNFHDKELMEKKQKSFETIQEAAAAAAGSEDVVLKKRAASEISYSVPQLMGRLANMFRVWPDVDVTFTDVGDETAASSFTEEHRSEAPCTWQGMIPHASGVGCICDRANGYTTWSDEVKGCVQVTEVQQTPACSSEGLIPHPSGTGCVCDLANGYSWSDSAQGCVKQRQSSPCSHEGMIPHPSGTGCVCDRANGYSWSDSASGCVQGALPQLPAAPVHESTQLVRNSELEKKDASDWRIEVQKRALQAQVYVTTAMQGFHAGSSHVKSLQSRWFGSTAQLANQEVSRILNSVNHMFGNVEYRYPGGDCDGYPDTYAYVFPNVGEDTMNSKGQYIVFLCDNYFAQNVAKQNEILVHEASHHATAYCNDLCVEDGHEIVYETHKSKPYPDPHPGATYDLKAKQLLTVRHGGTTLPADWDSVTVTIEKLMGDAVYVRIDPEGYECTDIAYGREQCTRLAEISSHKALRNADNFCYFVQDVTDTMYDLAFY